MAIALLLCGCAHQAPAPTVVATPCPEPPATVRPHLPAADLADDASPDEIMKAIIASMRLLQGYALELETVLDGYREEVPDGR